MQQLTTKRQINNQSLVQGWLVVAVITSAFILKVMDLNTKERTDLPQIHLSATDGKTKEEATEIVIHKLADGSIFIEWFPSEIIQKALNCNQFMATFSEEAKRKLIEFINSDVSYPS
jgi:hypothetical protein